MIANESFQTLREDLVDAASRLIIQRRRRRRLASAISVVAATSLFYVGVSAAGGLWPWQGSASQPTQTIVALNTQTETSGSPSQYPGPATATNTPSGDASSQVSALKEGTATPLPAGSEQIVAGFQRNYGNLVSNSVRNLWSHAGLTLLAASTERGAVCLIVSASDSASGSCTLSLPPSKPLLPLVTIRGDQAVVAIIATDGARTISVMGSNGDTLCSGPVVTNSFMCIVDGQSQIGGFSVEDANGGELRVPF